jgi:molecular chaperone IbpA
MTTTLSRAAYRPSLLGRSVFDNAFDTFFNDIPHYVQQSTQGYPVADIYHDAEGSTILEFALAGFRKEELSIDVEPAKQCITVEASTSDAQEESTPRRIARRNFKKTYINYDNHLNLNEAIATFENGLLTITVPRKIEAKPVSIQIS